MEHTKQILLYHLEIVRLESPVLYCNLLSSLKDVTIFHYIFYLNPIKHKTRETKQIGLENSYTAAILRSICYSYQY